MFSASDSTVFAATMAGGLVVLVTAAVILGTLFLVLRSAGGLNMIRELAAEQP